MIDMGVLTRLHSFFVASMPRVMPFYAVKCMPERGMMATLAALGKPLPLHDVIAVALTLNTCIIPRGHRNF